MLDEAETSVNQEKGPEMSLAEQKATWNDVRQDMLSGMSEWRLPHPKATLREIGAAVDERRGRLRKRMGEDAIQTSSAADGSQQAEQDRPCCRHCGAALVSRGKHTRRLPANGGKRREGERSYGTCPQ